MRTIHIVEGPDRTGKSTFISNSVDFLNTRVRENSAIRFIDPEMEKLREELKSGSLSPEDKQLIGTTVSTSELIHAAAKIEYDNIFLDRSFLSLAVYDTIRGTHPKGKEAQYGKFVGGVAKRHQLAIKLHYFVPVDIETMLERGSTHNSFEIEMKNKIDSAFALLGGSFTDGIRSVIFHENFDIKVY